MSFIDTINDYENKSSDKDYMEVNGSLPILLTAPHTMNQISSDGSVKLSEPYTKAIALYLAELLNINALVKIKDTGIDSNVDGKDKFKAKIIDTINKKKIKLTIDIHGASIDRPFDVELGTLNNLSADFSTINELKEAFIENGVKNVIINEPFKGGAITRTILGKTESDAIQIEINKKFRNIESDENIKMLCDALEKFISYYISIICK